MGLHFPLSLRSPREARDPNQPTTGGHTDRRLLYDHDPLVLVADHHRPLRRRTHWRTGPRSDGFPPVHRRRASLRPATKRPRRRSDRRPATHLGVRPHRLAGAVRDGPPGAAAASRSHTNDRPRRWRTSVHGCRCRRTVARLQRVASGPSRRPTALGRQSGHDHRTERRLAETTSRPRPTRTANERSKPATGRHRGPNCRVRMSDASSQHRLMGRSQSSPAALFFMRAPRRAAEWTAVQPTRFPPGSGQGEEECRVLELIRS